MSEVRFYHLQRTSLEAALPQMLERALARGQRAVVMAGSAERVEALAHWLWTYDDRGFLPHGTARDGSPELQPIWLTHADENPNEASVLFLTDGAASAAVDRYPLCVELFDGNDAAAVAAARARWKDYKAAGHELSYYQQDGGGRWEKRA
ncbi:MAG: DNA polymerase III subunit chi [Dongiaceae bacterium]